MRSVPSWAIAMAGLTCICAGVALGAHRGLLDHSPPALTIDAVAHQWWWEFKYPAFGITTSDEIHVPSDTVVRFRLTSADTIHSFWMPGMDKAVPVAPGPARILDLKTSGAGESYGTCDANCGCGAVCMRFQVLTSARNDFQRWVAAQRSRPSRPQVPPQKVAPPCASSSAS